MKIIKSIFFVLSLSFMIGCDSKDETVWVITKVKKTDENYVYLLNDESRIGESAISYSSKIFLGMPGDTVMLVQKKINSMQIYVPYQNPLETAKCLDKRRLASQIREARLVLGGSMEKMDGQEALYIICINP